MVALYMMWSLECLSQQGCTLYVLVLAFAPEHGVLGAVVTAALIFAIRAAAIRWNITVPERFVTKVRRD